MIRDNEGEKRLIEKIRGKRVLYVATKNLDYLRLQQEIKLIQKYSDKATVIVSDSKSYIKRILFTYKKLLMTRSKDYDVFFVGFMAQMIIPVWKWKFRKCDIIIDFFISVYDTLVDDRKKIKGKSLPGRFVHCLDKNTIKAADWIICDTKAHGKYFAEEFGLKEKSRLLVVYLEADTKYYHRMDADRPKKWKHKFLVLYFGSILPVQGVDIVMRAAELLEGESDIAFLIIGPIGKSGERAESDNVTYINWLPQNELAEYIAFSDLCLAGHFSDSVGKAKRTIPGKAYIYAAMGKRMILGDTPANRELFDEKEDNVSFVEPGNAQRLADQILDYYNRS